MDSLYRAEIGGRSVPAAIDLSGVDLSGGVVIRSTNWLGDAVMTLPGVYRIVELFPTGAPRVVLCPNKLRPLWESVPWIDEVVGFQGRRVDLEIARELSKREPSCTVVLPNSFGSAWDVWRAKLPMIIGRGGRGRRLLLNHALPEYCRIPGQDEFHQARHYLEMAACMGNAIWNCEYPTLVPKISTKRANELVPPGSGDALVLAPGAAYGPAKQWPVERFREVAQWWSEHVGPVLSTGAPNERDVAMAAVDGVVHGRCLAGDTSLADLVYVVGRARCVLANDSGTMHLGAALQRDGVAIFGSTDAFATGPVGGRWITHEAKLPCVPCLQRECNRADIPYECLKMTSPEQVIRSLTQLLETE